MIAAKNSIIIFCIALFCACAAYKPVKVDFVESETPPPPDYSNTFYWCALPETFDSADHIPAHASVPLLDNQVQAKADVFYIYPTLFFSRQAWNADLHDEKLNKTIEARAIYNQASVFNGSCRVYVPRYRQVTYNGYFSLANPDAKEAFALAYSDIRNAFLYYLEHYNNGRPIIIAGHSQGTTHAKQLLKDFFDGTSLQKQLICAYLLGMPVYKNEFKHIPISTSASSTGCFVTWRSYLEGSEPKPKFAIENTGDVLVTNPLTFSSNPGKVSAEQNAGGLGRDGETIYTGVCGAEIHNDIVWVSRPDIPGKLFIPKNLHVADYNLYWLHIRNNVAERIAAYLQE